MDLAAVMDEIAERLRTIEGFRVAKEPGSPINPPAADLGYPTEYTFDGSYGRGLDRMTLPVIVLIGRPNERQTRNQVAQYVRGSGPKSIKGVLESGTYESFDYVRVMNAVFGIYSEAAVDYIGAEFSLDIAGSGA